jgi:hypothetical protein
MMRWELPTKLSCVRQLRTNTWHIYSLSTVGGSTTISGKSSKTTSPRVATSTQRTALRLSYSWTGTQSWPQRTVDCRGQHLSRREDNQRRARKRRDPTSPNQRRRTLIRSTSRTYLASSVGRRVTHNRTAQQKPMMTMICPSPAG